MQEWGWQGGSGHTLREGATRALTLMYTSIETAVRNQQRFIIRTKLQTSEGHQVSQHGPGLGPGCGEQGRREGRA